MKLKTIMSLFLLGILSSSPAYSKIILDSDTIANATEKASHFVVNITTEANMTNNNEGKKSFNFGGFELNIPELPSPATSGTGSGIIIRENGYILTSNHVVKEAAMITVTLNDDEKKYAAELIAQDSYSDLALIKIDAKNLPIATFGKSELLRPGDWVIAIGSPLGLKQTVTLGIISAISRHVGASFGAAQGAFKYLQTDAAINPGNSGGPLVNLSGEVVGINTFIIGQNVQNLNFAIPCDYAKKISDELITNGSIKHPYLGIKMTNIDEKLIKAEGLEENTIGIFVIQVLPGSPAAIAGIMHGDVIQKVDGNILTESTQIAQIVRTKKVGEEMNFRLLRNGEVKVISVPVGEMPVDN